jgi:hypothetical protein
MALVFLSLHELIGAVASSERNLEGQHQSSEHAASRVFVHLAIVPIIEIGRMQQSHVRSVFDAGECLDHGGVVGVRTERPSHQGERWYFDGHRPPRTLNSILSAGSVSAFFLVPFSSLITFLPCI